MPRPFITAPPSPATWQQYAKLIEAYHGVWGGCWCLSFHPEGANGQHASAERRALQEARVRDASTHAALVLDDQDCIGWCQYGPTATLPRIKNLNEYAKAGTPLARLAHHLLFRR